MIPDLSARRLYGILDLGYVEPAKSVETTRAMLAGGVQILQLRAKNLTPAEILRVREVVKEVYMDDRIKDYIVQLVFATRKPQEFNLDIRDLIQFGASPRATIYLAQASRAHAFIKGRGYVTPEDIKAVGMDVLRHRIILTYEAEAEEVTPESIITRIFDAVQVP